MKKATVLLGQPRIDRRPQRLDCLIAEALRHALEELGFEARIEGSISGKGKRTNLLVVLWNTAGINLANYPHEVAIHVTSEQLPYYEDAPQKVTDRWEKNCKNSFKEYDCIFEHSLVQASWLKKLGYDNVVHFPWGYMSIADQTDVLDVKKEFDVRFMGTLTHRRRHLLRLLENYVTIAKHVHINRGIAIRQAKINLSLHNADGGRGAFPAARVIGLLLGNKAFTIAEPPEPEEKIPLVDGQHLIYINSEEGLKDKIDYYLECEEEREQIAQQGYDFVTQHYTMTQNFEKALKRAQIL